MPKHHYLPATYLALFSLDKKTMPSRNRTLTIGDLQQNRLFSDSAADVGCIKNMYTLLDEKADPEMIENIWARYETELPCAVENLIRGTLNAETWARILVPFVAGLFVRGPEFNYRFNNRLKILGLDTNDVSKDNTNNSRILELQRLLAPIIASKWTVIQVNSDRHIITNDLGYAPFANLSKGERGIAIPLGLHHILTISPLIARNIAYYDKETWTPIIEYVDETSNIHNSLNTALAAVAQRFIFGPDESTIAPYLLMKQAQAFIPEPQLFGFVGDPLARAYEFTWHRLVSALRNSTNDKKHWNFQIDWKIVHDGWHPPVFFPLNLVEFPSTLQRVGKYIKIEFYNPEVYYSISRSLNYQQSGQLQLAVDEATNALRQIIKKENKYQLLITRAEAYADLGNLKDALKDCHEAINLFPKKSAGYTDQGYVQIQAGQLEDAVSSFTKAIECDPTCGPALLNRGACFLKINKLDKAFNDISNAIMSLPEGPAQASGFLLRGNILLTKKSFTDAISDFSTALHLYPDSFEKSKCLYWRAVAHSSCDSTSKAIDDLSEALTLTPLYFDVLMLRARLYMKIDQFEKTISDLNIALPIAPNLTAKADIFHERAICNTELGVFQEANVDFENAIQLAEDKSIVSYHRGISLLYQGYLSKAIDAYKVTLENDPGHFKSLNNTGICKALQGKHSEAISYFNRAILCSGEDPTVAGAYRNKAISLAFLSNHKESETIFNLAEALDSVTLEASIAKGRLLWFRGEYSMSLETHLKAQKTLNLAKSNPFISLPLLSLGKNKEAISNLSEWLLTKPFPVECLCVISDLLFFRKNSPETKTIVNDVVGLFNNIKIPTTGLNLDQSES